MSGIQMVHGYGPPPQDPGMAYQGFLNSFGDAFSDARRYGNVMDPVQALNGFAASFGEDSPVYLTGPEEEGTGATYVTGAETGGDGLDWQLWEGTPFIGQDGKHYIAAGAGDKKVLAVVDSNGHVQRAKAPGGNMLLLAGVGVVAALLLWKR